VSSPKVPPVVWRTAVRTGRATARFTASRRPPPDFLVVGAQRAGTTSLHRYLLEHPSVLGARFAKGVHWYDEHFDEPLRWYQRHFPTDVERRMVERRTGEPTVVGESSPYYLFHPRVAERIAATLPEVKVIAILRDPVARAWSHYQHNVARDMEPLSFPAALEAEDGRLDGAEATLRIPGAVHLEHRRGSYVARGRYAEQLERLHEHIDPERTLVLFSHDLDTDPVGTVERAHTFLGLEPHPITAARRWNRQPDAELPPGTRERLLDAFAEPDARLARHLDVELPWTAEPPAAPPR
jgi:hypothetical protein